MVFNPIGGALSDRTRSRLGRRGPWLLGAPAALLDHAATTNDLQAAVERVRQADARFRAVNCRVEGDVVVLRPGAAHGEDVMALARAISRLPGLARIEVRGD